LLDLIRPILVFLIAQVNEDERCVFFLGDGDLVVVLEDLDSILSDLDTIYECTVRAEVLYKCT
jgi:hypothetical protein